MSNPLNRSDSLSSVSSSSSSVPGAFAYQTRLLERTSSLSRSSSQSKGLFSPNGTGTRRWTHRNTTSVDSTRKLNDSGPAAPDSVQADVTGSTTIEPVATGSTSSGSSSSWVPSHRTGSSVDVAMNRWEDRIRSKFGQDAPADLDQPSPGSVRASRALQGINVGSVRDRWEARVQVVEAEGASTPTQASTPRSAVSALTKDLPPLPPTRPTPTFVKRRTLPNPITVSIPEAPPSPTKHEPERPLTPQHTPPTAFAPPTPTRVYLPSTTSFKSSSISSVKELGSYALPCEPSTPQPPPQPRSAIEPTFDSDLPSRFSSTRTRRSLSMDTVKPDLTGSSFTSTASSTSVETPTSSATTTPSGSPYRSSYMARKHGGYGSNLSSGRKLGRHLPRIASGDGNEDWEEERRQEEEVQIRALPPEPPRESPREPSKDDEPSLIRRSTRRYELPRLQSRDLSPIRSPSATSELVIPTITSAADVQGVPGRLRLSRALPSTPSPLPSAKLSASTYGRGLWADTQRHLLQAYEYLCHVGEAQQWIEGCLGEELGFGVVEMEEGLRNGVVLARLSRVWEGEGVVRKIFEHPKLQYRHSDNINYFLNFVRRVGLPECFIFELTDLYEKKNLPKVIYCIHALSHLLARKGMAERIGNLLGQLRFSDDQLQQTQKGLDNAGVAMPNFGNVGKELAREINEEPEVEIETDDERRDRLLLENVHSIIMLQSWARGHLARNALATKQARLRVADRSITKLQARCRGFLVRRSFSRLRQRQQNLRPWVIAMQAAARGVIRRRAWRARLARIRSAQRLFVKVQAQARGVLARRRFARLKSALRTTKASFVHLQAMARAKLARKTHQQVVKSFRPGVVQSGVVGFQAHARGALVRARIERQLRVLGRVEVNIVSLQAQARGALMRRRVNNQLAKLDDVSEIVVRIQAASRAFLARKELLGLIRGLRRAAPLVVGLQARARANLTRRRRLETNKALSEIQVIKAVGGMQALARAALMRKRLKEQTKQLEFCAPDVVGFQAAARGALVRNDFWSWRDHLHASQAEAIHLQSLLRGVLQRRRFREKMRYYRANLDKVVKIQSLFRAKEQREQYRQLTMGKNVTVGTIKNFVHLLDDSEADFEDEIDIERLRKGVVECIRENQALEADVNELDVKIALVVQNVKSFEELIKARRRHGGDTAAAHAARASVLAAHGDPFATANPLDHATKHRLELYQQLFYLLQTKSEYLARIFFRLSRMEVPENKKRMAERVVLTLFGYGQDRREDYLLLKLFQLSIHEEVRAAPTINDILQGHPMYINVAVHYVRPKQVAYVREALQAVIREVIDEDELDLETDPVVIYRSRINEEEMRSGRMSSKPKDISFHQAVIDPDTRTHFIRHLQKLQVLTNVFVKAIIASTKKMPYGMRCIARETLLGLRSKFPNQPEEVYAAAVGKLVYYRYLNPAIVTPETFDMVPSTLGVIQRKNLSEISKMLTQISIGQLFGDDNPCLQPLNSYVGEAIGLMSSWFLEVANVPDAETQFHAHEFLDVTVQPKPIYISPNEVYSMHSLLAEHIAHLAPSRDDPLRQILEELGGTPNLGSAELKDARDRAITLELTNRFANVENPHADEKALWVQSKRGVLSILRVQPSKDLVESLMEPVTDEHEILWEHIVENELVRNYKRERRMPSEGVGRRDGGAESAYRLEDIRALSFREVKARAIYFLLELEKRGLVSRGDGYQGVLNAIAGDVRSKHRKRLQRQQEKDSMNEALTHLKERKKAFMEQINSYHSYAESAMNTMQRGRGKRRVVMPWSRQFFHLRDLQKAGKTPEFGSYKYSAQELYDKGILLSIDQFSPRQFDKINLVISSDQVGVFTIEVMNTTHGIANVIASADLRMEDLLHAQWENRVSLPLFDGMAKFNLNLLLYQINKKFYV